MTVDRVRDPAGILRLVLREIRVEHTLFALPFGYTGAIFGARGWPTLAQFVWITLAILGARTAAMAANRYVDRDVDARNPRTARRAIPAGKLAAPVMLWTAVAGLALLLLSAFELNPLCVELLPLAALGILVYPFCKRFTWSVHFVLGAVDGLAPLGAYVAVTGTIALPAVLLFLAVTVWVAGFDILYALMDHEVDLEQALHSIPARFGTQGSRTLAIALHVLTLALLAAAGVTAGAGAFYYAGVACTAVLAWYEASLLRTSPNVFVLNEKVFTANMVYSLVFLSTTAVAFVRHA